MAIPFSWILQIAIWTVDFFHATRQIVKKKKGGRIQIIVFSRVNSVVQ